MPAVAADEAAGREVGAGHDLEQLVGGDVGVLGERDRGVDDLAQVVRRDVGRHADGDAGGAVDQQVGEARRQDGRLDLLVVVVGLEVDGLLVDVGQQLAADALHAALGVAVGGRRIAVDRAEVALAVDQRVAHREVLREAHQGVVGGRVAVRVETAEHLADDARALHVGAVPDVVGQMLRVEDAPVDRLEAVAHVGQRARDDDAHGVVHERRLHLLLDRDRDSIAERGWRCGAVSAHRSFLAQPCMAHFYT